MARFTRSHKDYRYFIRELTYQRHGNTNTPTKELVERRKRVDAARNKHQLKLALRELEDI